MDRTLAYTALLEVPEFRALEAREGERVVTLFLADWYDTPYPHRKDMVAYAKFWAAGYFAS